MAGRVSGAVRTSERQRRGSSRGPFPCAGVSGPVGRRGSGLEAWLGVLRGARIKKRGHAGKERTRSVGVGDGDADEITWSSKEK